jgi:hypothetical protein
MLPRQHHTATGTKPAAMKLLKAAET